MKKIILFLTLLCLSLSARAHGAEVDGIFYNLDADNKTATVTFKGDNYDSYDNEYSGDVEIPETVTYNGIAYFVTSLGYECFDGCSRLTSITIPNSVTSLGDYCFANCSSLTSITIPNSVTSLGSSCFWGCSSLERMVVDAANPVYDSREDCNAIIHTSTNELVAGCKNSQIPNSVTSLGDQCFDGCSSLNSITIPNSVTSLGDACFFDCSSLTSITIPNSVTSLGDFCFAGCNDLTSITIPNSVTSLGKWCFSGCSSLTSITIPNSVTSLGRFCFYECSSLTSITIPNSITSLGIRCFWYCRSLTSITIPNSVTSLGVQCFDGCSSLTSITIPNSVTSLGSSCFSGCSSLTSIYMLPSTPPSTEEYIFYDTPLETVYVVDEDAKTAYQTQAPWSEYEIVVMPTGIEEVETDETAPAIVGYYDLNGKLINGKQRGAVIVRYSDGTTRKVLK